MFRYSIKYLNYCIKNHRLALVKGVPNEDNHKIKLFSLENPKDREKGLKKLIGKAKYNKRQTRWYEGKIGHSLIDVTDKW